MRCTASLLAVWALIGTASAQTITQTYPLRAGWNSIWLDLEPTNAAPESVFAELPLSSVWTYLAKDSPVEFIQQQTEAQFNQPGWITYLPPSRPDSFLTTLFAIHGLRAYLIKLTNAATLSVSGTPLLRPVPWVADSFNLRGFPVNPAALPTFATFFGPSPAHAGQAIYELQPGGQWQAVSPSAKMKQGEAYWSYCRGASTFQSPTGIELEIGDGLNFGTVLPELLPRVLNNSSDERNVCWRDLFNGTSNPLSYQTLANNRLRWADLPSPYCFKVEGETHLDVRLAIRRTAFAGENYASLLEITDDLGTRYLVPVTAGKLLPGRATLDAPPGVGDPRAGLWIGTASVTNVSEANSTKPMKLTPTRSAFDLRLLVHVDGNGKASLLKEVIQMWQNGTTTNADNQPAATAKPGRYVLLTDDTLLPQYRGASLRDGVPVGRRFSSVDFDFEGGTSNILAMTGGFALGNTNRCTLVLEPDFPTNPFKHQFHPDHGDLQAYRVARDVELRYAPTDPTGTDSNSTLEYGYNVIGGTYWENITGLHRTNIVAAGTFRLTRVANSPFLNQ